MTVYNINLGIGWASSGVEYAQAYRASIFRELQIPAKFIFTDMFQVENIQHYTSNIGFEDNEIIWLYSYFTDVKIAPSTYPKEQLEKSFSQAITKIEENGTLSRYHFDDNYYANVVLCGSHNQYVQRVEYVSKGKLIRKDYYTYTKLFSEYYAPLDNQSRLYQRHFFNEDGSLAYEEICQDKQSIFRFTDHICFGKEALIAYMLEKLELTSQDMILLDRATGIGQAVFTHKGRAKLVVVIHAEHYNVKGTDDYNVLWNNYYEYQFTNAEQVDAFITSTEKQKEVLQQQFQNYANQAPAIYAIPVGSLETLRIPKQSRKAYSLMTSSRLASEKHIDWLVSAVIKAHKTIPELIFDIYGEGGERQKLANLIEEGGAQSYITLKEHQNLRDVYQNYELYLTASTSEGFGLTLMEAVGSGLPIIGLDVPYGNQTFVDNGKNGYLIERQEPDNKQYLVDSYVEKLIDFYHQDLKQAQQHSYQKAEPFLHGHLAELWKNFVEDLCHD